MEIAGSERLVFRTIKTLKRVGVTGLDRGYPIPLTERPSSSVHFGNRVALLMVIDWPSIGF